MRRGGGPLGEAQLDVGLHGLGLGAKGLLIAGDRLLRLPQRDKAVPEMEERRGIIGPEANGLAVAGDRFVQPALGRVGRSQVMVSFREVWLDLQGLLMKGNAFRHLPPSLANHSQQGQDADVLRRAGQHLATHRLRLGQVAGQVGLPGERQRCSGGHEGAPQASVPRPFFMSPPTVCESARPRRGGRAGRSGRGPR
jgi:hypothetical protein